jgi:hypothetical protein
MIFNVGNRGRTDLLNALMANPQYSVHMGMGRP